MRIDPFNIQGIKCSRIRNNRYEMHNATERNFRFATRHGLFPDFRSYFIEPGKTATYHAEHVFGICWMNWGYHHFRHPSDYPYKKLRSAGMAANNFIKEMEHAD